MNKDLALIVAPVAIALLAACAGSASETASATAPTTRASTTTTLPVQRVEGTGTAYLMHAGPTGFVLFSGSFTAPGLGHGAYHEDGTFTTKTNSNPSWTAKATFTAGNGDTLTVRSVGGVQYYDPQQNPHSATDETILSGTGRFKGAAGSWTTTGITTVRWLNPQVALQTYRFQFTGIITLRRAAV